MFELMLITHITEYSLQVIPRNFQLKIISKHCFLLSNPINCPTTETAKNKTLCIRMLMGCMSLYLAFLVLLLFIIDRDIPH